MKKKESKYKVGDRIKIRSREWYDLHKDINGKGICVEFHKPYPKSRRLDIIYKHLNYKF